MSIWNMIEYVVDNYKYYTMDTTKKDYGLSISEYDKDGKLVKMNSIYSDHLEYIRGTLHIYINKHLDYRIQPNAVKLAITSNFNGHKNYYYVSKFNVRQEFHKSHGDFYIYPERKTLKFIYKKK